MININIIRLFEIDRINENFSECYINNNYFLINLTHNNISKQYISIITTLNENNIFIEKYILIYNNKDERNKHIKSIKNNLKYFLCHLQWFNDRADIISNENKSHIIGIIIEIKKKEDIPITPELPDDDYNLNYHPKHLYIKNNFNCCPNIGLQNIGATCYMNATLQCFCHIEKFLNFFKYSSQVIELVKNNKDNLTASFRLLIEKLWPNNINMNNNQNQTKYYAPKEFKEKISKMNPLFEGIATNDAKDLVNFIIMTLHQELNKAKINQNDNKSSNFSIDQRNQQEIFNCFMKDFTSKNISVISDLFYSTNCTITECLNCQCKLYNYQIYFFIIFPLEEVRKYKIELLNNQLNQLNNNQFNMNINMNMNFNMNINEVNIFDCFDYDRKINYMIGSNSIYCNNCRDNCNGTMTTYLVTGPEVLILLLNRGKGIEFNVKINFVEILDLTNYIEYKDTGCKYKLIGIITHIGESSMSGHFISYCRDPITEKWFKYNDAIITEVNNFQNDVINFAMPYLLFYQKII